MKLWLLAGLFSVAAISSATAATDEAACSLDGRQVAREEAAVTPVMLQTPVIEAREVRKAADRVIVRPGVSASVVQAAQPRSDRRRNGRQQRVPDSVLIDGRGVL